MVQLGHVGVRRHRENKQYKGNKLFYVFTVDWLKNVSQPVRQLTAAAADEFLYCSFMEIWSTDERPCSHQMRIMFGRCCTFKGQKLIHFAGL